ncbi:MAG: SCP2 sterol-binding domain-containing protein [Acidimicrobiales bacterium]
MATFPFLSDEWIEAARLIREEHGPAPAAPGGIRMNQVITDVPFGAGSIDAHLDSSSGEVELELGHLEAPDVTITVDYDTAKHIFVDQDPRAVMQAFMAGRIIVQGDMAKLLQVVQGMAPGADVPEVATRIKAMTA